MAKGETIAVRFSAEMRAEIEERAQVLGMRAAEWVRHVVVNEINGPARIAVAGASIKPIVVGAPTPSSEPSAAPATPRRIQIRRK